MLTVEEQFEKLLYSVNQLRESLDQGDKRKACGDADYIQDRTTAILYLLLAEIEDEDGKL